MKKTLIISLLALVSLTQVTAQTAEDALRYSRVFYSGTARYNGLGGAFGAVGADFSTLATNPAGLGLYNSSEVTFTIAPTVQSASSSYNGTTADDNAVNFGIGNFGLVFNITPDASKNGSIVRNVNLGIGFNRQNDFNNKIAIHGVNMKNSMMLAWTNTMNAQNLNPDNVNDYDPFGLGLADKTWLAFYDTDTKKYYCDALYGGVVQDKTIETSGSMNELDLSVGANIGNKLFAGLTIGVPFLNYYESSRYYEARVKDTIPNFISLNYWSDLHTRGTGVNLKFGLIYKPVNWFRVGASIHSPTWYLSMHDRWYTSMESNFDSASWNHYAESPVGTFDYRLTTPFRAMGSLAFIIGKYGLVSADYEYVNYASAKFHSSEDSFSDVNSEISNSYQSCGNIRVGTEWRISSLYLRGGFGYFSNPYKSGMNNSVRYQVSGGVGYRAQHFFADLSYVWSKMNQDYYLYDPAMVNPADVSYHSNTILATAGIRF